MKNRLYWSYNLPLQLWPKHKNPQDKDSPVVDYDVLNYSPRKERVVMCSLDELRGEQTREEYLETAAIHLENLARLFREAIKDEHMVIYYHDEGMENDEEEE
jgi:hypothetical protein